LLRPDAKNPDVRHSRTEMRHPGTPLCKLVRQRPEDSHSMRPQG
jgi:hypothetical protein